MKIALAQINPTVGDLEGNLEKIEFYIKECRSKGANLCVFPEMAVTGYPAGALLESRTFTGRSQELLQRLADNTKGIAALVGYATPNPDSTPIRPAINAAALIENGKVVSTHAKTALAAYCDFDERRYVEPAKEVKTADLRGKPLGITFGDEILRADSEPASRLVSQGAEILVNIAAIPFDMHRRQQRQKSLTQAAQKHGRPIVFVNQVGGNDELVFNGYSMVVGPNGSVLGRAKELAEDLVLVDLDTGEGDIRNTLAGDEAAVVDALALGTRDFVHKCGFKSVLVGLSGGIDSAVVASIAARALGPQNVYGVSMPSRYSSKGSLDDAETLADNLGIHFQVAPIDGVFQTLLDEIAPLFNGAGPDVTEENMQARIRCITLMSLSNKHGHLLLATGNRSEAATGYATLYGDLAGGLAMLSDVPKGTVYRIAAEINRNEKLIPEAIVAKPPSAELRPGQKDEDSLPPYSLLDAILELLLDKGLDVEAIVPLGFDRSVVADVARMVRRGEFKRRQAPPGLRITTRSIAPRSAIPIANRWTG